MRMIPDPTGRFPERPFYDPAELDLDCEKRINAFLRDVHGKIEFPVVTDDLTKLIERHVRDFDQYADLSLYGPGVEGVTEFYPGNKPNVRISDALSNDAHRENRLRTTLTHELGHVFYHTWLFDQRVAGQLFPKPSQKKNDVQVCKRDTILDAPQSDWMEWQAGHACGALLMPVSRIKALAREVVQRTPPPDMTAIALDSPFASALIDGVVDRFQVSREAARVRLQRLRFLPSS